MKRYALLASLVLSAVAVGPSITFAQQKTEDETIRKNLEGKRFIEKIGEHTRDSCDRANDLVITSTTDGDVVLRPGDTKYFRIRDQDAYTRSGGWYWKCGNALEKARIKGATLIKAVRSERGVTDWYSVTILKN